MQFCGVERPSLQSYDRYLDDDGVEGTYSRLIGLGLMNRVDRRVRAVAARTKINKSALTPCEPCHSEFDIVHVDVNPEGFKGRLMTFDSRNG